MMYDQDSTMAANAICHAAAMVQASFQEVAYEHARPSVIFKPRLYQDGNQWCALYGEDLQSGVAGFGDSPEDSMRDFDRAWNTKLKGQK